MEVQRKYKNNIFTMLFGEKKQMLRLFNAMNGTDYADEEELEVTTLENAIYMNMKNDLSFVLDFQLSMYEHQSTVNPNIPLRDLLYVAKVLSGLVAKCNLYGSKPVEIPTPRFVVFYNGAEEQPARQVYCLSKAFAKKMGEPELELKVTVININPGYNDELLAACRELGEYSRYVDRVRRYAMEMPIEQAVERAVTECIREGILADFLKRNRAEAIEVSIFEYNEQLHHKELRREGYELGRSAGRAEGKAEAVLELLEDLGDVPAQVRDMICAQKDLEILKRWNKVAAKAENVDEFVKRM